MRVGPVDAKRISPAVYLAGREALSELRLIVADLGRTPILVHGRNGIVPVARSNPEAIRDWSRYLHEGACTEHAIDRAATAIELRRADVVVALGGGRVLDVAKAAADQVGAPVVTVPTSPATCAAMTALSVLYTSEGPWLKGRLLAGAPSATIIDLDVLRTAPARLLAAGVLDATAKTHEVRLALSRAGAKRPTESAATALSDRLDAIIDAHAHIAFGDLEAEDRHESVDVLAESAIAFPGWIGGMAGEANKLAAAHAIHNGFTLLPESKRSLHGELVGFGVVVQTLLDGSNPNAILGLIRTLGAAISITELGCSRFTEDPDAQRAVLCHVLAAPAMQAAFPGLDADVLSRAIFAADEALAAL